MEEILREILKMQCLLYDHLKQTLQVSVNGSGNTSKKVSANIKPFTYSATGNGGKILDPNKARQGIIVVNLSNDLLYIAMDPVQCSADNFTFQVPANGTEFYIPTNGSYPDAITYYALDPTGKAMITELSYAE